MKHFLILLFVLLGAYVGWQVASKRTRSKTVKFSVKHGLRLGFMVLVLGLLLIAAASYKSFSIV